VVQEADAPVLCHVVGRALALVDHDEQADHHILRDVLLAPDRPDQLEQRVAERSRLARDLVDPEGLRLAQSSGAEDQLVVARDVVGPLCGKVLVKNNVYTDMNILYHQNVVDI
jgi:hypothetical protein